MRYPVQTCLCKHFAAKDGVPIGDSELARYDYGFLVITVVNYLFKVVLLLSFQFFHSEVIDNKQIELFYFLEEPEFMSCKRQRRVQ